MRMRMFTLSDVCSLIAADIAAAAALIIRRKKSKAFRGCLLMKRSQFVTLLIGAVGGLLFALGMCMCLLPEWNALAEGRIVTAAGLVILLALGAVGLVRKLKSGVSIHWKTVGKTVYGVLSALVLGVGMCAVTVWQMIFPGIIIGIVGIVMLLCLIPMCVGLKK